MNVLLLFGLGGRSEIHSSHVYSCCKSSRIIQQKYPEEEYGIPFAVQVSRIKATHITVPLSTIRSQNKGKAILDVHVHAACPCTAWLPHPTLSVWFCRLHLIMPNRPGPFYFLVRPRSLSAPSQLDYSCYIQLTDTKSFRSSSSSLCSKHRCCQIPAPCNSCPFNLPRYSFLVDTFLCSISISLPKAVIHNARRSSADRG